MKRIIAIIVMLIVLTAIIMLVIFGLNKFQTKPTKEQANINNSPSVTVTPPSVPPANVAELAAINEVKVLVKKFSEIYGSYSTDNNFENLESLKPSMTANLTETVNKIIADGTKSKEFFGVTTRLISQLTEEDTKIRMVVRAKTQRQETGSSSRLFYQDLVLTLVKTSRGWLVDQAKWQ